MKRVIIFVVLTIAMTWAPVFWLMFGGGLDDPVLVQVIFSVCMLIPAMMTILTRLITKEGFRDMKLRPHFKGNGKIYLAAWFGPTFLTSLGAVLYFLIFPRQFDPSMSAD